MSDINDLIPYEGDKYSRFIRGFGLPDEVLANPVTIGYALRNLQREFSEIPPMVIEKNKILLARMLIAASTGLFDAAINYIWNVSIISLRNRVIDFGIEVVSQIRGSKFDQKLLNDLKDYELIKLCLELNLINEEAYFFLDQCRDTRNHFSAAHPPIGELNDRELVGFTNRCVRFAISADQNPTGVDMRAFISAIKASKFSTEEISTWRDIISQTHEAQREQIFSMLYGMYCDPAISQDTRLNCLEILSEFSNEMAPNMSSLVVQKHGEYLSEGVSGKVKASSQLLEKLGKIGFLAEVERARIFINALKILVTTHHGYDNFYNEPPHAKRILELREQSEVPASVQREYVRSIITCAIGNEYGVSNAAETYYTKLVSGFSPREISIMLDVVEENNIISRRVRNNQGCKRRYKKLLTLIDINSVPKTYILKYKKLKAM